LNCSMMLLAGLGPGAVLLCVDILDTPNDNGHTVKYI
jgi:hypothetical protein